MWYVFISDESVNFAVWASKEEEAFNIAKILPIKVSILKTAKRLDQAIIEILKLSVKLSEKIRVFDKDKIDRIYFILDLLNQQITSKFYEEISFDDILNFIKLLIKLIKSEKANPQYQISFSKNTRKDGSVKLTIQLNSLSLEANLNSNGTVEYYFNEFGQKAMDNLPSFWWD